MQPNLKVTEVINFLKSQGKSDVQIAQFWSEVEQMGFTQLYLEAITSFTDEDMKAIESAVDDETASKIIKKKYVLRTGKNPEDEMRKYLDTFSEEFLKHPPKV